MFLSAAPEDAEVARRIAEGLRPLGVEVWFDQAESGADGQGDARVRTRIKDCALFLPLVSQHTEARTDGGFRQEWRIAVERTQEVTGRVCLLPVAIDDTPEAGAAVPKEFGRQQWARLPGGEVTPEFVAQVKRLLDAPRKPVLKSEHAKPPTLPEHLKDAVRVRTEVGTVVAARRPGIPKWIWVLAAALVAGVIAVVLIRADTLPV